MPLFEFSATVDGKREIITASKQFQMYQYVIREMKFGEPMKDETKQSNLEKLLMVKPYRTTEHLPGVRKP